MKKQLLKFKTLNHFPPNLEMKHTEGTTSWNDRTDPEAVNLNFLLLELRA